MARENGMLADRFNTCFLDEPIPLSVYKHLKKKEIPRFRPRSVKDYMRISMKYSNKSNKYTLDETDYNKEDIIRHWFTEAKRDDYIIEQIMREFDLENPDNSNSDTWAEFFEEFSPFFTPLVMGEPVSTNPPSPIPYPQPYAYPTTESSDDSEVVITNPDFEFELPDHLKVVTSSSGNESSSSGNSNETGLPAGLTQQEYDILVNEFGEEEVLQQFS